MLSGGVHRGTNRECGSGNEGRRRKMEERPRKGDAKITAIGMGARVVRLKNRFKTPLLNGYCDALYNIVVSCGNGATHVRAVQLHLADIVAHKEPTHVFSEYFRTYFSGSREKSRMKALQSIQGWGGGIDSMITSVLQGSDRAQLENLYRGSIRRLGKSHLTLCN